MLSRNPKYPLDSESFHYCCFCSPFGELKPDYKGLKSEQGMSKQKRQVYKIISKRLAGMGSWTQGNCRILNVSIYEEPKIRLSLYKQWRERP